MITGRGRSIRPRPFFYLMMKRRSGLKYIRIAVVLSLCMIALESAPRADDSEHWTAVSNTAISITGDVLFTPSRITFQNKAALPLFYLGTGPGLTWAPAAHDKNGSPVRIFK